MKTRHKSQDQPLDCRVEGNQLVIRIGIDTLAFAAMQNSGTSADIIYGAKVIDNREWAKDVRRELLREEEDGSSPLTNLLDRAMTSAAEEGSTALEYPARKKS